MTRRFRAWRREACGSGPGARRHPQLLDAAGAVSRSARHPRGGDAHASRHRVFLTAGIAACLLAAGVACVSAPGRTDASLPVTAPDQWAAAEPGAAPAALSKGGPPWWTSFDDPALNDLIGEILASNHDLKAAATRIDAAAAQARIAGADLYPQASASARATRRKQNFIGFPSFGGGGKVLSTRTTIYGASLDTIWEVDLWGRLRAGEAAALADLQATAAEFQAARLSLAGQGAKAWFALSETDQRVDLARRTVESFQRTVDLVRDRFARGLRSSLDLRLALSNLHAAEAGLEQALQTMEALRRQVETLAGRYPQGSLDNRPALPPLPPPVPAGLPADLISRRPDLAAAERRLAASGARLAQARRALYPRLTLTGSFGTQSEKLSDLLDGDFSVWSLIAGLAQPLFQGGRLRAGVDLADARQREALELYAGTALNAYREVETALDAERRLALVEHGLAEASRQAAEARRLAEERYRSGLDDFLTVLEAQRRDIDAERRLIEVRRLRLDTRVDLHLALGGGFTRDTIEIATKDETS